MSKIYYCAYAICTLNLLVFVMSFGNSIYLKHIFNACAVVGYWGFYYIRP